jgi:alginate production protein
MRFTISLLAASTTFILATPVHAGSGPELAVGQYIKVEGRNGDDGTFFVEQVTVRDADGSVKIEGAIATVSANRAHLRVLGFNVTIDSATRMYRGSQPSRSRAMLAPGAWIEAKGSWRNGTLKATRIRYKDTPEATEEIEGPIEAADPNTSSVVVMSRRVILPAHVPIIDERTGTPAGSPAGRLRRDDDDGEGRRPLAIGDVVLGGRLEAGFLDEANFEIGRDGAERAVLTRAQLLAAAEVSESVEAYAKVTMARNVAIGGTGVSDARVSEAYLLFHGIGNSPVDLQVGRQRFKDNREWFFDEYLDAARVHVTLPAWKFEAAVARGLWSGPVDRRQREDQLHLIASAGTRVGDARLVAYAIGRRDTTRNETPVWIGTTVRGTPTVAWTYWGTAAVRRGSAGAARLGGWALDTGFTHRWARRGSPAVTVGYAAGSGDPDRADGHDTRFRQTDLEDNRAYFGGVRRFAAYGELFDPELSNLRVFSAGGTLRPRRTLTIDVVYHQSSQSVASTSLPSGNLDGPLDGIARGLGREVNVALTLRAMPGLDVDVVSGVFLPGAAFLDRGRPAFFWRPQLRFYF